MMPLLRLIEVIVQLTDHELTCDGAGPSCHTKPAPTLQCSEGPIENERPQADRLSIRIFSRSDG